MKITYTDNIAAITPKQLEGFLAHWDFVPPENALLRILRGSSHVLIAQDSSSQEVMGYITALSDGVSSAHITHRFKKMHAMSKRNRQGEPPATCVATAPPVRLNIGRTL